MEQFIHRTAPATSGCYGALMMEEDLTSSLYDSRIDGPCTALAARTTCYGLLLITRGNIEVSINFFKTSFKVQDVLCMFPDSVYQISAQDDAAYIAIYFSHSYLKLNGVFFNSGEVFRSSGVLLAEKLKLGKEEFKFIYYNMLNLRQKLAMPKSTPFLKDMAHNCFRGILYDLTLIDSGNRPGSVRHDGKAELTNRFLASLSQHFKKEKRLSYYAALLRITPRHLSQVVKQVTGKTAGEIIDEIVIREAKLFLTGHLMNVSEVALALNFSNASFFGKYFKKHTGLSPYAYRLSNTMVV